MDFDEQSKLDQQLALASDVLPPAWKRIFDNLLKEGFNRDEALKCLLTFINASSGGKFSP